MRFSCRAALVFGVLLAGCTPPVAPHMSAADEGDIGRISAYLNGLPRFEAPFVQSGDFGPGQGEIFLDRPGHLRVDYAGPGARLMVITDNHVTVLDRATGALTTQKLSRTPLGMLLTPQIVLGGAITVVDIHHADGRISVKLQKTDNPGQGSLTLAFAEAPLRLQAVSVADAYHHLLTITLGPINPTPTLTPALFQPPAPPGS